MSLIAAASARLRLAQPVANEALSISAPGATVEQDSLVTIAVTLTRTNTSTPVTMSVSGLPSGVTPSWDFETRGGANDTSRVLTLTTSPSATVGAAALTITATPVGGSAVNAGDVTLTITEIASTYTSVAAAIKRYDGGSGAAWFRGTIPFAPGVVTSAADLDNVRLLIGDAEPASGLFIELVEGYHPDDSYKAGRIEFQATVNDANAVSCEVRIGQARTETDRTEAQNTVEFTTRAWQLNPTVFGITDPAYLVASRIAPMPLVVDSDPRIPAALATYAGSGLFDSFLAATATSTAQYDEPYACYTRYLTSGNLDFLVEGARRHASNGAIGEKPTVQGFSYYTTNPDFPRDTQTYPSTNAVNPVNLNPVGYATTNGDGNGRPNEPFDMALSQVMTYWLTGWEYGRLHVEKGGAAQCSDFRWTQGTSATTLGGEVRNTVRRFLFAGIAAALLRPTREMDMKSGNVFRSGTNQWGAEAAGKSMAERAQREMARHQSYRDTVLEVPAWLPKMIGFSTTAANASSDTGTRQPNFQFEFAWIFVLAYLNGIIDDPDMLDEAEQYGAWLMTQVSPLRTATNYHGSTLRTMPYRLTPPATVADGSGTGEQATQNGTYLLMVAPIFALHYALTGDTASRDMFDEAVTNYSRQLYLFVAPGLAPAAVSPETLTVKLFGQTMHSIRHAIAWRVNGYVGWEP